MKPAPKSFTTKTLIPSAEPRASPDEKDFVFVLAGPSSASSERVIDPRATFRMCFQKEQFTEIEETPPNLVKMGNRFNFKENGDETVTDDIIVNEKPLTCKLQNVLFEPMLTYSLLMVTAMARAVMKTVFESGSCSVYQCGKFIAQRTLRDMHYYLNETTGYTHETMNIVLMENNSKWHKRRGHVHTKPILNMDRCKLNVGL